VNEAKPNQGLSKNGSNHKIADAKGIPPTPTQISVCKSSNSIFLAL
jgi:hypothetical protein